MSKKRMMSKQQRLYYEYANKDRVKKELEANNFVVKESLNEERLKLKGHTKKNTRYFDQRGDVREFGKENVTIGKFREFTDEKDFDEETRKAMGITDSLARLSVGLEHSTDLIKDLEKALQ